MADYFVNYPGHFLRKDMTIVCGIGQTSLKSIIQRRNFRIHSLFRKSITEHKMEKKSHTGQQ